MGNASEFVLGLDLDGVVADFNGHMRAITTEWRGVPMDNLPEQVTHGLREWGLDEHEYTRLHRFAVTQRKLFSEVPVMPGASQARPRPRDLTRSPASLRGRDRRGPNSDLGTKSNPAHNGTAASQGTLRWMRTG
jgi:hypothetical protein